MSDGPPGSLAAAVERALEAYEALVSVGEAIEDEWTWVTDLSAAWRERLMVERDARGAEALPPAVGVAVERACDEVGRIRDPYRAIDWLSTFPQVVLIAMGAVP